MPKNVISVTSRREKDRRAHVLQLLKDSFNVFYRHRMMINRSLEIKKKEIILDLGCGPGNLGRYFERKDRVIVYSDIQFDYFKNFPKTQNNAERIMCDGKHLPFKECCFDLLVCSDVIEHIHITQRDDFLTEVARVVKGYVLLSISTFCSETNGIHLFTKPFKILRLPFPAWYLEHSDSIRPRISHIISVLNKKNLNLIDFKPYQGLISIFLTGIHEALFLLNTRAKKRTTKVWAIIISGLNFVFYLIIKHLDLPPFCSFYLKFVRSCEVKKYALI